MESSLYGLCAQVPKDPAFMILHPTSYAEARERAISWLRNEPLYQLHVTVFKGYSSDGVVIKDPEEAFPLDAPAEHIRVVLKTNWYEDIGRLYRNFYLFPEKSYIWENLLAEAQ